MGHRTLCNCILVKRSEDKGDFIRAAIWCVLEVIQRHTRTHVGGHGTQGKVALLSYHKKDRSYCGCPVLILMHVYLYLDVVDVLDK